MNIPREHRRRFGPPGCQTVLQPQAAHVAVPPGFECYREAARLGFEYLRDAVSDREYGGWFRMLVQEPSQ